MEIFKRDEFECAHCGNGEETLHIHHKWYVYGNEPWDYPSEALITLCESCHESEEVSKGKQKDLIKAFLSAGFFNMEMEFLAGLLSYCFQSIYKEEFESFVARLGCSEPFREDVRAAYRKECERLKQIQQSQSSEELPF